MRVNYSYKKQRISKSVSGQTPFMLTNKKGGYFFGTPHDTFSKFNGLFFPYTTDTETNEWNMYKTVEFLGVEEDAKSLTSNLSTIKLTKPSATEEFYLNHSSTLIYEVSKSDKPIALYLDCKKIYDDSADGRLYSVSYEDDHHIIHYKKYKDDSLSELDYEFYIAIKTNLDFERIENWVERYYSLDKHRGENPLKWVYEPLHFIATSKGKLVLAYAETKESAIDQADKVYDSTVAMKKHKQKYVGTVTSHSPTKSKEDSFAYAAACVGFDSLITSNNDVDGIYAGLPWFFHYWSRDEAISLIGLLKEEHYELMKSILLRWLDTDSVKVSNRFPIANLGSADAAGWLYFRLHQLLETLKDKNVLEEYFTKSELQLIYSKLMTRISVFSTEYLRDGLIHNSPLETWMDTGERVGDVRDGARIEIQALFIAMYNTSIYLGKLLGKKKTLESQKEFFVGHVKESFFKNGYLWDGSDDSTIRPNVFIAAYVAPELLSKKEWVSCFENMLPVLTLEYEEGIGISTIDKSDSLFKEWHSGQSNESYHRGDSWFWINSLVAVVLNTVGPKKFSKEISGIKKLVLYSLFWDGAAGQLAEITSAKKLLPQGCYSQAWSYALLIELLHEKI